MSSTYGLICLNHNPGIEIGDHTVAYEPDTMLAVAKNPAGRDWPEHTHCDLVVAAYSYPIVRIACPGKTGNGAGCRWHDEPKWTERDLLRLLIAACQAGDAFPGGVMEPFESRCWSRERALRLGPLLGLSGGAPTAAWLDVQSGPVTVNVVTDEAGMSQGLVATCRCGDKWIWDSTAHGVAVARFLNAHAACGTSGAATVGEAA